MPRILIFITTLFFVVTLYGYSITVISEGIDYSEFYIDLSDTDIICDGDFTDISLPSAIQSNQPSSPDLPAILLYFAVPEGGGISVNMTDISLINISLDNPIRPASRIVEGTDADTEYIVDQALYSTTRQRYEVTPTQSISSYDFVSLSISPFHYDHENRRLQFPQRLKVRVSIHGVEAKHLHTHSSGRDIYRDFFINQKYASLFQVERSKDFFTSEFHRGQRWFLIQTIRNNGVYELNYATLNAQLPLAMIDPHTFRIFSTSGAMMLPRFDNPGQPFMEIPIYYTGNDDSTFRPEDKIYFYGESRHGFGKNLPLADYRSWDGVSIFSPLGDFHYENPYSVVGVYWLTWGSDDCFGDKPKRMAESHLSSVDVERSTGKTYLHREIPNIRVINRDEEEMAFRWYSHRMLSRPDPPARFLTIYTLDDINVDEVQEFTYVARAEFHAPSGILNSHKIAVEINSATTTNIPELAGLSQEWRLRGDIVRGRASGHFFHEGENEIVFLNFGNFIDRLLKSYTFYWHKNLIKREGALSFYMHPDDVGKNVRYTIENETNGSLTVFQIDSFYNAKIIPVVGNTFIANGGEKTWFYIYAPGEYQVANALVERQVVVIDDEDAIPEHDVAIIYPAEFSAGAQRLARIYRESYGYKVYAVTLESVLDNFSGGYMDPVGIRNFLQFLHLKAPGNRPMGATLIGSGVQDYRNFTGIVAAKNKFPVNQIGFIANNLSAPYITHITSDDFYGQFTSHRFPDIVVGRITARTPNELNIYLDKLEEYIRNPMPGWWQYTFQTIADDHHHGTSNGEVMHTQQVGRLSADIRNNILVDNIFAIEYHLDPFKKKPHVKRMLVDKINEGRLFWVYVGHGSIRNTGDEQYFSADFDLPLLRNRFRYPIFFAASCNVGQYDLAVHSLCDELIFLRNAGSILSIGATRKVPASSNELLVRSFSRFVINERNNPGIAMIKAKIETTTSGSNVSNTIQNNPTFNLIGDPFLHVAFPNILENIAFSLPSDTLMIRQTVKAFGNFSGTEVDDIVYTLVYDSGRSYMYTPPDNPNISVSISKENLPIFNGSSTLNTWHDMSYKDGIENRPRFAGNPSMSGRGYDLRFIIPDDTASGARGKIFTKGIDRNNQVYINKRTNITISSQAVEVDENVAPQIELFLDSYDFRVGDTVSPIPTLYARISSPSGINTIGASGHNIMLLIDSVTEPIMVTSGFRYDLDSYTEGELVWRITGLEPGRHSIKLVAFNSFNRFTVAETWFTTAQSVDMKIKNALVYPNPMQSSGYFTFEISHDADVTIDIFTITGRKIRTIRHKAYQGYNQVAWNGRDSDGHRIANNTYIYKITAIASEVKGNQELTDKFIMLR
jgi:hypothetical protein